MISLLLNISDSTEPFYMEQKPLDSEFDVRLVHESMDGA